MCKHSKFFGIGAYTRLLFYTLWGWPPAARFDETTRREFLDLAVQGVGQTVLPI